MIDINWNRLRRNYEQFPLQKTTPNKYEDLTYAEMVYLTDNFSFCEIVKIFKVSDHYLQRQLKLYNLKTKVDRRKNPNKLSKTELELKKYGKLGLSHAEKLKITIDRLGREEYNKRHKANVLKTIKSHTKEEEQARIAKIRNTKLLRYGNAGYNNINKIKATCKVKYGVDYAVLRTELKEKVQTDEVKEKQKISRAKSWSCKSKEEKKKIYIKVRKSKKTNGTIASSKSFEDHWYNKLKIVFPYYTILRQYSDIRYPFSCDFYIKELDLFIEMQGKYFHNKRPFKECKEDIAEYNALIVKGKQAASIAKVWRYKDPLKRSTAKNNSLNYIEFWEGETDLIERVQQFKAD